MKKLGAADLARLSEIVPMADPAWIAKAGDVPLLKMPAETFAWNERMIYFANTGVSSGELYLEVRAFADAPEIEQLGWKLGWGEGWSDSRRPRA